MIKIDETVLQFLTEQNQREKAPTVHARFLDEAGRCVILETGERMPHNTHPVYHHFYFGKFTLEQAVAIADTLSLKVKIHPASR